jgi:hypothetical protein
MRENMIVGESLTWADLLKSIKGIEDSIHEEIKRFNLKYTFFE